MRSQPTNVSVPRSPTTGEPMTTIARRARAGLWTFIVLDVAGTLALVVSYTYLWSLNVNGGWAPPGASLTSSQTNSALPGPSDATFAEAWPFWMILAAVVGATVAMGFGYRELSKGHRVGMMVGGAVALTLTLIALVWQWIQITSLPFGASNGAYASAVLLLCASNVFHLLVLIFLLIGILNRTRLGLVSPAVPYQAQLLSRWMVWVCIAVLLGALCTTFLEASPNANPSIFGTFQSQT